ncbi:SRPBCC family protein [Acrocarpospora catenulata]|uniref:SRPBCC family protein n=1 Tax=Acrocarpospora catenulata TaxID=2836182 RepID=UPI001BDB3597|nr:SRPBCC family protein [Acrocarpospora catenulata]
MPSVTSVLCVDPDAAFAAITDLPNLPSWNERIIAVPEVPPELTPDAVWISQLHIPGYTWRSRSRILSLDQATRHFSYVSQTDDGNPSHTNWTWQIAPHSKGCAVTVKWTLTPLTFWRQRLLVHVRGWMLRDEVAASLRALEAHVLTIQI